MNQFSTDYGSYHDYPQDELSNPCGFKAMRAKIKTSCLFKNAKRSSMIALLAWIIGLNLIGALIAAYAPPNNDLWYQSLPQSKLTPPDVVFPIAWTFLYATLGASGWLIFNRTNPIVWSLALVYLLHLILNGLWSPMFFGWHHPGWALVILITMLITLLILMLLARTTQPMIGWLLTPYLAWLVFATYLNAAVLFDLP